MIIKTSTTVLVSKFVIHVYTTPTTHHMMPMVEKLKSELRWLEDVLDYSRWKACLF